MGFSVHKKSLNLLAKIRMKRDLQSHFHVNTQWCDVKPIFVLMEMADRAGDGSTKLQINF